MLVLRFQSQLLKDESGERRKWRSQMRKQILMRPPSTIAIRHLKYWGSRQLTNCPRYYQRCYMTSKNPQWNHEISLRTSCRWLISCKEVELRSKVRFRLKLNNRRAVLRYRKTHLRIARRTASPSHSTRLSAHTFDCNCLQGRHTRRETSRSRTAVQCRIC